MKTVKLITCNDAMKAHILQGALENEGIESILHNENFSTLYKSCVSSIAGVDILVADDDYEKAVQVLRDNQSWPEELTLCPYCGSSDMKFRLKKGQRLRAVGAAILSMLAAAPPGDNHWEYTCGQCQCRGQRTTVHRHERLIRTFALCVDVLGNMFFARTVLT